MGAFKNWYQKKVNEGWSRSLGSGVFDAGFVGGYDPQEIEAQPSKRALPRVLPKASIDPNRAAKIGQADLEQIPGRGTSPATGMSPADFWSQDDPSSDDDSYDPLNDPEFNEPAPKPSSNPSTANVRLKLPMGPESDGDLDKDQPPEFTAASLSSRGDSHPDEFGPVSRLGNSDITTEPEPEDAFGPPKEGDDYDAPAHIKPRSWKDYKSQRGDSQYRNPQPQLRSKTVDY